MKLECEEFQIRHANCLAALGPLEKECLDRELIFNQCVLGKTVPKQFWKEWKQCEKGISTGEDPSVACFDELEKYVFPFH